MYTAESKLKFLMRCAVKHAQKRFLKAALKNFCQAIFIRTDFSLPIKDPAFFNKGLAPSGAAPSGNSLIKDLSY